MDPTPDHDPTGWQGWLPAWPWQHPDKRSLRAMRARFTAQVASFVVVGVIALWIAGSADADARSVPSTVVAIVICLGGLATATALPRYQPNLPTHDPRALVSTYCSRFYARLGMASVWPMLGLAGSFQSASALPYIASLLPAAIALRALAPTEANLATEDDRLARHGSALSLRQLLRQAAAPAP